jgi:hypothetical protein
MSLWKRLGGPRAGFNAVAKTQRTFPVREANPTPVIHLVTYKDFAFPSSAAVKNAWRYTSIHLYPYLRRGAYLSAATTSPTKYRRLDVGLYPRAVKSGHEAEVYQELRLYIPVNLSTNAPSSSAVSHEVCDRPDQPAVYRNLGSQLGLHF